MIQVQSGLTNIILPTGVVIIHGIILFPSPHQVDKIHRFIPIHHRIIQLIHHHSDKITIEAWLVIQAGVVIRHLFIILILNILRRHTTFLSKGRHIIPSTLNKSICNIHNNSSIHSIDTHHHLNNIHTLVLIRNNITIEWAVTQASVQFIHSSNILLPTPIKHNDKHPRPAVHFPEEKTPQDTTKHLLQTMAVYSISSILLRPGHLLKIIKRVIIEAVDVDSIKAALLYEPHESKRLRFDKSIEVLVVVAPTAPTAIIEEKISIAHILIRNSEEERI